MPVTIALYTLVAFATLVMCWGVSEALAMIVGASADAAADGAQRRLQEARLAQGLATESQCYGRIECRGAADVFLMQGKALLEAADNNAYVTRSSIRLFQAILALRMYRQSAMNLTYAAHLYKESLPRLDDAPCMLPV